MPFNLIKSLLRTGFSPNYRDSLQHDPTPENFSKNLRQRPSTIKRIEEGSDGQMRCLYPAWNSPELQASLDWKQNTGRNLWHHFPLGSGGHALGTAMQVMAFLGNGDGASAVAKTLATPGIETLLASKDPEGIAALQDIESKNHAMADASSYPTPLGRMLRSLSKDTRTKMHILGAWVEGLFSEKSP